MVLRDRRRVGCLGGPFVEPQGSKIVNGWSVWWKHATLRIGEKRKIKRSRRKVDGCKGIRKSFKLSDYKELKMNEAKYKELAKLLRQNSNLPMDKNKYSNKYIKLNKIWTIEYYFNTIFLWKLRIYKTNIYKPQLTGTIFRVRSCWSYENFLTGSILPELHLFLLMSWFSSGDDVTFYLMWWYFLIHWNQLILCCVGVLYSHWLRVEEIHHRLYRIYFYWYYDLQSYPEVTFGYWDLSWTFFFVVGWATLDGECFIGELVVLFLIF